MKKFLILDCFVDEPACFGVPPFISPYPRYIFGALISAGCSESDVDYLTIEDIRGDDYILHENYSTVFIIGGAIVPGKYLGSKIGTLQEIIGIVQKNNLHSFVSGGLISSYLKTSDIKNLIVAGQDIEAYAFNTACGKPFDELRSNKQIAEWSVAGSAVVKRHRDFPYLIAEIETYRGCPRQTHCSFCSESIHKNIEFREIEDIISEISSLINNGISRFRIGRQADILSYGSDLKEYRNGFSKPSPVRVVELFNILNNLKRSGTIELLNIDNANPGTIANFPDESALIIEAIANAVTPGDTMALGVESFDPVVLKQNSLKVNKEEAFFAVKMINELGGRRKQGLPKILPGINLIHNLIGENLNTFKHNYNALKEILDKGLLVKRINIRKLNPFPGTIMVNRPPINEQLTQKYKYYKEKIRSEIDNPMLKIIYPAGTILKNVRIEDTVYDYSLGKQLASYSITMKIAGKLEIRSFTDTVVVGHNERSLLGLPTPILLNSFSSKQLELIPGVGKKRAADIICRRPFKDITDAEDHLSGVNSKIKKLCRIN